MVLLSGDYCTTTDSGYNSPLPWKQNLAGPNPPETILLTFSYSYFRIFFRFMYVCRPFSAQTSNMLLRAKIVVAAACLLGLTAAVIRHYMPYKVVTRQIETGERYFLWVSNGMADLFLFERFYLFVWMVLNFVVPFLIIITLTAITIFLLLRRGRERKSLQRGAMTGKPDHVMTITLVGVVVTYISLRGPIMFVIGVFMLRPDVSFEPWFDTLKCVTVSLAVLDPISNFIIYFVAGKEFRRSLRRTLVCRCERGICCRRDRDSATNCVESNETLYPRVSISLAMK